jgi:hypothetical protein
MDELDLYYDALFKEGRKFERRRKSMLLAFPILNVRKYWRGFWLDTL